MSAERYDPVNSVWKRALPPITREEAGRAARKLLVRFGVRDSGRMHGGQFERASTVRRVWIANKARDNSPRKGWPRLVHDVSHLVFRFRYPEKLPHDPLHARLELEMTQHVLDEGWLDGKLKPKGQAEAHGRGAARRQAAEHRAAAEEVAGPREASEHGDQETDPAAAPDGGDKWLRW